MTLPFSMTLPSLMTRKNESPQRAAMREMMRSYLKDNAISIKDGTDAVPLCVT